MYKDKDKQREAQRDWVRQKRKGSTKQGSTEGSTRSGTRFIPDEPKGMTDERSNEPSNVIPERTVQGNIRVSKPGDSDYEPQCETTRAFIEGRDKRPESGKRGKDIKTFADLPPGVQRTIDMMAMVDGHIDKTIKANRTAIAINYQHLFPDRFYSSSQDFKETSKQLSLITDG